MHTHHLSLPDAQLAVHTSGSGRPLLLLHAFPLDHRMWVGQEPLADQLRLIIPDQRGFGGSRTAGCPTSLEQLADDAVALLDALHIDEPAIVCGCSMGGYVAQHVAIRHPTRVRSLILVDTKLEADTPEAREARAESGARFLPRETKPEGEVALGVQCPFAPEPWRPRASASTQRKGLN
jgi:pimeloyl-ACP methyl ester carboxylesterase